MPIQLVRHAHAGSRRSWEENDDQRPLSAKGAAQAHGLADALAGSGVTRLVTSPSLRCRQTLEPLAARLGLHVEVEPALAEGSPGEAALARLLALAETDPGLVACSHGDVIPQVLDRLADRGVDTDSSPSLAKAGRVELEVEAGRVLSARTFPPPPIAL